VLLLRLAAGFLGITFLSAGSALATPPILFETGLYDLGNHPDGNAAEPTYGARIDNLYPNSAPFTFDFECDDCGMSMNYDGSSIHIFGTAFGGQHDGVGGRLDNDFDGLYGFNVTYGGAAVVENGGTGDDSGLQDIGRPGETGGQIGSLEFLSTTGGDAFPSASLWDLMDKKGGHVNSLRVGNEDNDLGHRDSVGISGWGWLKVRETDSRKDFEDADGAQDFLFIGRRRSNETPEPGSTALLLLGLAAIAARRNKR
jgi:hypothetical protein